MPKIKGFYECPLVKMEMCTPYADFLLEENEAGMCRKCGKPIRLLKKEEITELGKEYLCKVYEHIGRDRFEVDVKIAHSMDTSNLERKYFVG